MATGVIVSIVLIIAVILYQKREKEDFSEKDSDKKLCKYCRSEIDEKAKICPYCRKEQKSFHIWKVVVGVVIGCFIMVYLFIKIITSDPLYTDSFITNKNYITLAQFESVKNGMTLSEVQNIVGCDLQLMSETGADSYSYEIYYCYGKDGVSNANFSFNNNELVNKTQIGLN